ncbi:MAG: DUF4159 domain-containing protein [Bacteroidota bacterium]
MVSIVRIILVCMCALLWNSAELVAQTKRIESQFRIARLKYSGGGDWYNDPSAEVNLLTFARLHAGVDADPKYEFTEIANDNFFSYPFIFMTGHGNVNFSDYEVRRLRTYLESGGFLYIDDDYGMDKAVRRELKKVFPEYDLVELPYSYGLYSCLYSFPNGVPKTHEHDNKPPQGFGLLHHGRLVVYYTVESNPSDGWTDADVHNNPPEKREEALKFGTNIIVWSLQQ